MLGETSATDLWSSEGGKKSVRLLTLYVKFTARSMPRSTVATACPSIETEGPTVRILGTNEITDNKHLRVAYPGISNPAMGIVTRGTFPVSTVPYKVTRIRNRLIQISTNFENIPIHLR